MIDIVGGFLAAAVIAVLAWRAGALAISGAVAAVILGGVTVAAGGWNWGALLILFFVTSSALSKIADRRKPDHGDIAARGSRRDAVQVLANGGIPGLFALINWVDPRSIWYVAFAAALAAAAADTWATEIGAFSPHAPRLITTFAKVEPGRSGAISVFGTLGSAAGALLIGLAAGALASGMVSHELALILAVAVGGFSGSLIDSGLGATVQAIYRCPRCGRLVESPVHSCGTRTVLLHGHRLMTNDVVNAMAVSGGVLVALLLWSVF